MPRCCDPNTDLTPTYASILVAGTHLEEQLGTIEQQHICPCITTWCAKCHNVSMITSLADLYPHRSAYYANVLVLHRQIQDSRASAQIQP